MIDAAPEDVPTAAPSPRGRRGCAAVLLLLLAATSAHWAYWYRPRARALAPASSRLLPAAPALPVRLWLPYPRQNLHALGGAVERPEEVLAAAARLAGLPDPSVPRLAPFGIPPAHELLIASSRDGKRLSAAVRLYPTAALLVRLSGLLASNPWLAGGEVRLRDQPATARWEGLTWRLETADVPPVETGGGTALATGGAAANADPALAIVDLAAPVSRLPPGRYALRREGGDLVWRLGSGPAEPLRGAPPPGLILVWVERRPQPAEGRPRAQALLLMEANRKSLLAGLPSAAAWAQPDGALEVLPGGSLLRRLAGVRPVPFADGELAATERAAAARARELAPFWLPLAAGRSTPPLALGGWLAIDPAAAQAEQLHRLLEEIPILGAAEAQRWGDVAVVLRAAHGHRTLSCWLAEDGSRGELRLAR